MLELFHVWRFAVAIERQTVERPSVKGIGRKETEGINQESSSSTVRKESVDQVLFPNENNDFLYSLKKQMPWKYNSCL